MSSVGNISLDLNVNHKEFDKQVKGIEKKTSKVFGTMSVAIGNMVANMVEKAVAGMGNFVKDSINLGSELSELQNVVESVYGSMTDQVNQFAQDALASFGLTEAQAKKMMGTFGAMSKSFGYTTEQAYEMSSTLTGLAGDVASFYNLSIDEAYTKLKSVYTGETESLKELGIVMTQTALDEFALANGFGKTTSAMSEQEKVMLRYMFVQDKLALATGDFTKTQAQWANQTRILSGQFESFKANLGQGLINILTPVLRVINTIMAKLVQLAGAFKSFTEMIMGVKNDANSGMGSAMQDMADAAGSASDSTSGMADASGQVAKNAAKAQKALMGFDEINKLSGNSSSAGGSGSEGSESDMSSMFEGIDFVGAIEEQEKQSETYFDRMKERALELVGIFKEGFSAGLGSDFEASIERIKAHAESISHAFKEIFSDDDVEGAAAGFVEKFSYALGQIVGSITSVGVTIGELLIGGLDKYLNDNASFIKDRIVGIYDALGQGAEAAGDLVESIASIFEVFRGDNAKTIASDIIEVFSNATLGTLELAYQLGADIVSAIVKPFVENEDKIKTVLENTLKPLSTITSTIADAVTHIYEKLIEVYDSKIKPAIQDISDGIGQIFGTMLDVYNEHIAPVLDNLANKFRELWDGHLKGFVDKVLEFLGSVISLVGTLWKEVVSPFISWVIETIVPKLTPIIEWIVEKVIGTIGHISDVLGGVIEAATGVIDFIKGVFSGDWQTAWDGVKEIFSGVWSTITSLLNIPNIDVVAKVSAVKDKAFDTVTELWNGFKDKTSTLTATAKNAASSVFTTLKDAWTKVVTKTATLTGKANNAWPNTIETLRKAWSTVYTKVATLTGKAKNNNSSTLSTLKSAWNTITTKTSTLTARFNDVFTSALKKAWNTIAEKVNAGIVTLNKVPGINITARVPKLAEGGYVRANQPQLAVIGDNKRHGEIVSPEDKMTEVFLGALNTFFGKLQEVGYNAGQRVEGIKDIIIPIYLDGNLLDEVIISAQQRMTARSGGF